MTTNTKTQQQEDGTSAFEQRALAIKDDACQLVVKSVASYTLAGQQLRKIRLGRREFETFFKPMKTSAHKSYKAITNREKEITSIFKAAEDYLMALMGYWDEQQERIRLEAQRKAEEAARKQAEDDKITQAEALEKQGHHKAAENMIDTPIEPMPVVVPKTTPRVEGVSQRKTWKWRVKNADKVPREYLCLDTTKISGVVRSMKGSTNIHGIEAYEESSYGVRK